MTWLAIIGLVLVCLMAFSAVCISFAKPIPRFDDEVTDSLPVTPEAPTHLANGVYIEPDHVREKRLAYLRRRAHITPQSITRPSLVNAILAEHNEARQKDGKIG